MSSSSNFIKEYRILRFEVKCSFNEVHLQRYGRDDMRKEVRKILQMECEHAIDGFLRKLDEHDV